MKPQVLQRELFQLSEKIVQLTYKIEKHPSPQAKEILEKQRSSLNETRQRIKMILRVLYENQQNGKQQCIVA